MVGVKLPTDIAYGAVNKICEGYSVALFIGSILYGNDWTPNAVIRI